MSEQQKFNECFGTESDYKILEKKTLRDILSEFSGRMYAIFEYGTKEDSDKEITQTMKKINRLRK